MSETVRWSVFVSKETDMALRAFLAHEGHRKGGLSKFVEDAVRWRVLDRVVSNVKAKNSNLPPEEIDSAIDNALEVIRAEHFKQGA